MEAMKDKETQVGNGKRLVNTSGMRSDPICHENEEEALKAHCVFGNWQYFMTLTEGCVMH